MCTPGTRGLFFPGLNGSLTVTGLVFSGCAAMQDDLGGGGLLVVWTGRADGGESAVVVEDCTFVACVAGGPLAAGGGGLSVVVAPRAAAAAAGGLRVLLRRTQFVGCVTGGAATGASGGGAAFSIAQLSPASYVLVTVHGCSFTNSSAAVNGGGMYFQVVDSAPNANASLTVVNTTFERNFAGGRGGGVAIVATNCSLRAASAAVVSGSSFLDNLAGTSGGGVYGGVTGDFDSPSPVVGDTLAMTIVHGYFARNIASVAGGGITTSSSTTVITSCVFVTNTAVVDGGAVALHVRDVFSVTLALCSFERNLAGGRGGGLVVSNSPFEGNASGRGVPYVVGSVSVATSGFVGNSATSDGGALAIVLGNLQSGASAVGSVFLRALSCTKNTAHGRGGAVALLSSSDLPQEPSVCLSRMGVDTAPTPAFLYTMAVLVDNSTFTYNRARAGGALGAENGTITLREVGVSDNWASFGGGIFLDFGTAHLRVASSSVANNVANWSGNQVLSFSIGSLAFVNGSAMSSATTPNNRDEIDVSRGGNITVDGNSVLLRCTSGNSVKLAVHVDAFPAHVAWWEPCVAGLSALRAMCVPCPSGSYALSGGVISPRGTVGTDTIENPKCRQCPYGMCAAAGCGLWGAAGFG